MGVINFVAWLCWVLSPVGLNDYLEVCALFRRLSDVLPHVLGVCGKCPNLASYNLAFGLQLRKITENVCQVKERCSTNQRRKRLVSSTWPSRAMTSTGLLAPAALGFRLKGRVQPLVSISIWRVAELRVSPPQLTLNQTSKSGLWYGQQIAQHTDICASACYLLLASTSSKPKTFQF